MNTTYSNESECVVHLVWIERALAKKLIRFNIKESNFELAPKRKSRRDALNKNPMNN